MAKDLQDNLEDKEILVVYDEKSKKMKVVASPDEESNSNKLNDKPKNATDDGVSFEELKLIEGTKKNASKFLTFEKRDNILENFLENFLRQAGNPSHTGFYRLGANGAIASLKMLDQLLKMPEMNNSMREAALSGLRIDPEKLLSNQKQKEEAKEVGQTEEVKQQKQLNKEYKPFDESRIDWKEFEKYGVTKESIDSTNLNSMLNYKKTNTLIPITISIDNVPILDTDARLSLVETPDGRIVPKIHAIRVAPPLDRPFHGHTFTDEDKQNLRDTGTLGRTLDLKMPYSDKLVKCYVGIDKLTYDIVALDASKVRIPNDIKGLSLNEEQRTILGNGGRVALKDIPANKGGTFEATVEVDPDTQRIKYTYPEKEQKQKQEQANTPKKLIRVHSSMLERPLSPEEQERLKNKETVFLEGLFKHGKHFDADVRINDAGDKFKYTAQTFETSNDPKVVALREKKAQENGAKQGNKQVENSPKKDKKQNNNSDSTKKVEKKRGRKI